MNQISTKILNPEQIEAVEFGSGPLLIIAGAGTGKTTVITERIKWLISQDLARPSEILALTFTQKAAAEMEERIDILMPYGYTQMWISTFHAFCEKVLRESAVHIGLDPGFKIISDTDAIMLIRKNIFKLDLDYFRPLGNPTKFIKGMIHHFSRLHDEDISPKEYLARASSFAKAAEDKQNEEEILEIKKINELAKAYQSYQELKIKEGLMDYSDLISNTLRLFRERKNILKEYQDKFKFILVDEFQDTNIAQNELLLLLSQKNKNITAVADDDQSIYKFRGAAVSNVISFRKNFPKSKLVVLTQNYRSTQEILDKSYQLIQYNNPDRLETKEGIVKKLRSSFPNRGDPIKFIFCDRVENEADEVAKEIKDQKINFKNAEGEELYNWKDFAILLRANSHAEPFVRSLIRHGIPFQFLGPGQLFRQPEVKDLIAYLHILSDIEDSVSLYRVLSMKYFDISSRDLIALASFARKYNYTLFETCEIIIKNKTPANVTLPNISKSTLEKLSKITSMITRHFDLLIKETGGQILYYFLEDTGMIKNILDYKFPLDEKKAANISKFFSKLKTYEIEHQDSRVDTILDWINLSTEMGESPLATDTDWTENDAVNILTVHSAKGLEFKVVFLVNLVSQRFPTVEKSEQIPIPDDLIKEELPRGDYHEQEERRLFYVGMTRAKERLYFTAAKYYGEGKRDKHVSSFVTETLGDEAIASNIPSNVNQLGLLEWKKEAENDGFQRSPFKISYISYSQIDSFKLCPLHYKLRYILNIPPPVFPAASFGVSIHNTLKDFYLSYKRGEKITKDSLVELLEKDWIKKGYTTKSYETAMFERGRKYLLDYYQNEFDPKTKTIVLEQPFMATINNGQRSVKIGGKIDRIDDLGGGKIEIIDYKTGRVPSQRQVDTDLQLSIYALAVSEINEPPFDRNPKDVILSLYFFDNQKKITTKRSPSQIQSDKEKIFDWIEKIESSDFKCSGNIVCTSCEYKMFCNVYNEE